MNSDEKLELLARYRSGKATLEEVAAVEAWFETIQIPQSDWEQMPPGERELYVQDMFVHMQQIIWPQEVQIMDMRPLRQWRIAAAAAAIILVALASWLIWPVNKLSTRFAVVSTPAHLRYLRLPDSSMVWVNAGSQLQYPAAFSGKTREVYLSGEAYFDIRHQAAHPFIIHTGNVVTTVLGTAFNIKENPQTHQVTVTVKRGKVSVMAEDHQPVILLPDQQANVNSSSEVAVVKAVNSANATAWHSVDLHFDNNTFGEAVQQLADHYGVSINFSNAKLAGCRFTGTASADEPLDQVLKVMCAFNNSTFSQQKDGAILISGAGCP